MILDFEQFNAASDQAERIIQGEIGLPVLREQLELSGQGIEDRPTRREFYRHINTLLLNALVNRLTEVGRDKEPIIIAARRIIVELINSI